ncbi:MAG: hypothetical protein JW955_14860 [Sedimentisphaerales bacterium]|nr:hypothetical protein [Sedimentisphaerales bacterium]
MGIGKGHDRPVSRWFYSHLGDLILTVLFFALLYVYVWRVVKPCLIYSCGTITDFPIFYKGWAFFLDQVSGPGGLLTYVSALLSQLFYYSWAGAIVITAQAWVISACTGWLFRAVGVPGARWWRFVPALLVLVTYSQYTYHLPGIMGAVAALLGACGYVGLVTRGRTADPGRGSIWHLVVFIMLSAVVYVVSAAAFLPFAAVCAVYELLHRRRYVTGLAYLAFAAIVPYVAGVLLFRVSLVDAYTDLLPLSWRIRGWATREKMVTAVYALYLFPIAGAIIGGLWQVVAVRWRADKKSEAATPARTRGQSHHSKPAKGWLSTLHRQAIAPAVRTIIGAVLVLVIGGGVAAFGLDEPQRARLEVHYYACRKMWPEVLEAARRHPVDHFVMNAVDRALWHTGRLTLDMFSYPQQPGGLLLTGEDHVLVYWNKFDTQIDLGLMNTAEKNLTECMETFGEQPMILQRLAMVNLVRGTTNSARVYLGALSRTLFYSGWARDYLARLDADPSLAGDREIQELRSRCLRKDNLALFYAKEEMLAALAAQDNRNRMAFEYLMAWYLQTRKLDKFIQNIERLSEFGYATIPPLYQEALAIYAYPRGKAGEYPISPDVRSRFESFSRIFNRYRQDKAAAFNELAGSYRDSYLFYYIYGP